MSLVWVCRPDVSASSRSLHNTQEVAAMTRSLPEHEVLKYLTHGHPVLAAEGSSITSNTFRYTALFTVLLCLYCYRQHSHLKRCKWPLQLHTK